MGKKRKTRKKAAGDEQICRSTTGVETRGSKSRKKSLTDETGGIQPPNSNLEKQLPPDEHRCGRTSGRGWRCKNFRMGHGAAADNENIVPKTTYCEKHYNYYAEYKNTSGDGDLEKKLPPDEHRCGRTSSTGWRCKNFRMGHGADADNENIVPKTTFCEKHYKHIAEYKKTRRDGDMEKKLPPDEQRCVNTGGGGRRCKNFKMSYDAAADDANVPKTEFCEKHYNYFAEKKLRDDTIVAGGCDKIGAKRKHVERTEGSGELKSSTKTVVETSNQPATDDNSDYTIVEGGSDNNGRKRKHAERMSRELESLAGTREAAAELESLEHHKSKSVELEKKKAECTELVKKAKKKKTRKTTSIDENEQTLAATERWKKLLLSCLQSKVNEKSTWGCGESHISNSESLVFRSGKESSLMRCVELGNSERVKSEVPGLQNDITQSCENPTETSVGRRKDSHVHDCKTKEKVLNVSDAGVNKHNESESEFPDYAAMNISSAALHLSSEGQNVEEGEGWGISKRSSKHGSDDGGESLNEYEDFDIPLDSKNSLGDPMDMLAMKNWKRNNDEMKWKSEPDMLSSFEDDPEICLKAICALYRQEISEDPISPKGLLFDDDTFRCITLAKFLMDEDCKGDLKKSMKELETLDSKAVADCKMLARRYSLHLFYIYKDKKDPFFRPATTASQGE